MSFGVQHSISATKEAVARKALFLLVMFSCSRNNSRRTLGLIGISSCYVLLLVLALSGSNIPTTLAGWISPKPFSSSSNKFSGIAVRSQNPNPTNTIPAMSSSSPSITEPTTPPSFKVLGVCGGIGSGKSTACKLLVSSCNCLEHIDVDKIAHSVYAPGSDAVRDVVKEFGEDVLFAHEESTSDKDDDVPPMEIDRKKLGAVVFAERSAMARLEEIVWPHVGELLSSEIERLRENWKDGDNGKRPVVVVEAAVLLDAGWDDLLDGTWAVTVPRENALARLMETRGLTEEEATKRIDAQDSRRGIGNLRSEVEAGTVTKVIVNDGSLEDLEGSLRSALDDLGCWKA